MARLLACLSLLVISHFSFAQITTDIQNSSDHPLIGRYPDTFISNFTHNEYDSYNFPEKANTAKSLDEFKKTFKILEGDRTTIVYDVPKTTATSRLKIYRSIEASLKNKGFETVLTCTGETNGCGYNFFNTVIGSNRKPYSKFSYPSHSTDKDSLFYSGKITQNNLNYYVFIAVAQTRYAEYIQYSIDVLKEKPLETKNLVLTVDKISENIEKYGTVTLDGLYFDHNKTTIKAESEATLNAISDYLKKKHKGTYLLVGHTDTVGDMEYNQKLSLERAYNVSDKLHKKGIGMVALMATGVGMVAPVATNLTKEGRAKNRRVELVFLPPQK